MGRFFVRLDVVPHPADHRRSSRNYHVVCNACKSVLETIKSLDPQEHELRHDEAHQIAESLDFCEACGSGFLVSTVAESDTIDVSAQMD